MNYNYYFTKTAIKIVENMVNHGYDLKGETPEEFAARFDYNVSVLSVFEKVHIWKNSETFKAMP